MLPVNPNQPYNPEQTQLLLKINELNKLESWGSRDVTLVPEGEIESVVEDSFKSLKSCPNEFLSSSLLNLTERIKSEDYIGSKLKDLASQVQKSLSVTKHPVFPISKELNSEVVEKMNIKSLSKLSRLSHEGNLRGKEATIARIQKLGYEGADYDGAIKYLKNLNSQLRILSAQKLLSPEYFNSPEYKLQNFRVPLAQGHLEDILGKLKNLSNKELISLFTTASFYSSDFDLIRKFLYLNFDPKNPLEVDDKSKEIQALALHHAIAQNDESALEFLLRLGIAPDSKYEGETALDHAKRLHRPETFIDIIAKALTKPE